MNMESFSKVWTIIHVTVVRFSDVGHCCLQGGAPVSHSPRSGTSAICDAVFTLPLPIMIFFRAFPIAAQGVLAFATGATAGLAGTFVVARSVWMCAQAQGTSADATVSKLHELHGVRDDTKPRQVRQARKHLCGLPCTLNPSLHFCHARSQWRCRAYSTCGFDAICAMHGMQTSPAGTSPRAGGSDERKL